MHKGQKDRLICASYINDNVLELFIVNKLHCGIFSDVRSGILLLEVFTVAVSKVALGSVHFNTSTTEKQTTKFSSANFQKMLSPSYIILRIQRLEGKQCRAR